MSKVENISTQEKQLVLFDFDGTLTKGDSMLHFLWFALPFNQIFVKSIVLIIKFISLILSLKWSNELAKESMLGVCFQGRSEAELKALGEAFCQQKLPVLLRPEMMERLKMHRNAGHHLALVSASVEIWLRPFCEAEGLDLICTELEYQSNIFTGKLATRNCNGLEKARRIKETFALESYTKITAYGNSPGDYEMLFLADEAWLYRKGILQKAG